MKILTFFTALAFLVFLPVTHGRTISHIQEENFSLPRVIKVYHYWDACECYMLITDDGKDDNCEYFYNGSHFFDNGECG
jgi:hypothetical protein